MSKEQAMSYLSTSNVLNLSNFRDEVQIITSVKPVNAHSNHYFSQLSRNPVDNLVVDPVIILG
ncbi:hypothetical protein [Providencia heimbachae]|uniref:hypothetical protein n=1 Tax=Providencia heimbachae TaxID=333962 RepID=UPI000AE9A4B3|nr:hypothetical protein [Providencia heimbachae]SQH12532.1 Uncharacterised protein [Providencia heimbachae]